MKEFECSDPAIEVLGPAVEPFLSALGSFRKRGEKVLARNCGVEKIATDSSSTFPLRGYLDALKEFQDQFGVDFMNKTGALIFEKAMFPPGIDTAAKGMGLIDVAYNMNHQKGTGKIGGYHWTEKSKHGGIMMCDNPYPCNFDMGIVLTIAKRFEAGAKIRHLDPKACRHLGHESCSYEVEW